MTSLVDMIGGVNLFNGITFNVGTATIKADTMTQTFGCSFTFDRFCNANSAVYFNGSYLQAPAGIYFKTNFSLTAWVYLKTQVDSAILSFGTLPNLPDVQLYLSSSLQFVVRSCDNSYCWNTIQTQFTVNINQWYHVAYVRYVFFIMFFFLSNLFSYILYLTYFLSVLNLE